MRNTTTTTVRLIGVAFAVLLVFFIARELRGTLEDYAELPGWDLDEMPLAFGEWQGAQTELDEELTRAIDADDFTERQYHNQHGDMVAVHTAAFTRYSFGVQHNPYVCYRAAGWEVVEQRDLPLDVGNGETLSVPLVTWQRPGGRVMTLHWYQLGDQYLFDRWGLARARLHYLGRETWPALHKVLLHTPVTSPAEAENHLKEVAEHVHRWLNEKIQ